MSPYIVQLDNVSTKDVATVGGKNASLGEMIQHLSASGVLVPRGFALTVAAYREYLTFNGIGTRLQALLNSLNTATLSNLASISSQCKELIMNGNLPKDVTKEIKACWADFVKSNPNASVAVRSSASAEDSPSLSFAGQHESFLNVANEAELLESIKKCYASLFNERAIKYRLDNGVSNMLVDLSVGVQQMVRSDKGSAGVAFTIEPENGNENLIYITGAWGLGESVVQG
ncbi:MAG TPA: PEP/pyruvate-binding domain-containing protein, partial [Cyclobacteriaceae bacterium]|nr:PEP/pyruvate-binding domain-containing protein [Cyclobacteriaceae bacterium]